MFCRAAGTRTPPAAPDAGERRLLLPRVEVQAEAGALAAARRRLDETAGAVGLVDAEQCKARRASILADALGYAAGVFVQPRFGSEEARLSIRGSGLQRTFHLRGLELLQDGVPLNQADGGGDFQAVELLAARFVEIYRGANALQYGAATLGGAVNFVSPDGRVSPSLDLRLEAGSFGYLRSQVALAGAGERDDYYASLSSFSQDGYRAHARQETLRLFANYGRRLAQGDTRFYLTRVNSNSQLPGSLTWAGVAPQLLRTELRWDLGGWYIAPNAEWSPQRSYVDHANTLATPGYAIAGLRIGGDRGPWRWFADARNLGGRRYAATTGVIADARGLDSRQFLPGDGRSAYLGLEWRR